MSVRRLFLAGCVCVVSAWAYAGDGLGSTLPPLQMRVEAAGGMGVAYVRAMDIVDLVNAVDGVTGRVPDFKSAVEFFGYVALPVTEFWMVKLDYAYLLTSYTVPTTIGSGVAEHTVRAHLPSVILQYVLLAHPLYNLKIGAGGGYHVGSIRRQVFYEDDIYTAHGAGAVLECEGNTALGEHLYASLGASLRWEWMGILSDDIGRAPGGIPGTTMHMFAPAARIGVGYVF